MAASGLCTKRDAGNEVRVVICWQPNRKIFIQHSFFFSRRRIKVEVNENERREQVVLSMVQFAVAMMETLERFNKDALQEMRLRIGISVGPVIAGVVGASKPQCELVIAKRFSFH